MEKLKSSYFCFVFLFLPCLLLAKDSNEEVNKKLILACQLNDLKQVKELFEQYASANVGLEDKEVFSTLATDQIPLAIAMRHDNKALFDLLVEHHAQTYVTRRGYKVDLIEDHDPFHFVIKHNDLDKAKEIYREEKDLERKEKGHRTPLHIAAEFSSLKMVTWLLERGANIEAIDFEEKTPIFYAFKNPDIRVFEKLIEAGANLNLERHTQEIRNGHDYSPLAFAARKGLVEHVKALLAAKKKIKRKFETDAARQVTLEKEVALKILKLLVAYGCDLEGNLFDRWSLLTSFSYVCNDSTLMEFVLEHGAALDYRDDSNCTPIFRTIHGGNPIGFEFLVKRGARLDLKGSFDNTLLHDLILRSGESVTLERLLAVLKEKRLLKKLINEKNEEGETALHAAVQSGKLHFVEQILEAGADHSIKNNQGLTPFASIKKDFNGNFRGRNQKIAEAFSKRGITN